MIAPADRTFVAPVPRLAVPTAVALVLPAFVLSGLAVLTTQPAAAAGCRAPTTLLSRAPVSTYALPGGATARVWDTGDRRDDRAELRIAAVRVPARSLTPDVLTAPTVARAVSPGAMAAGDARAVVVINGGHFDPAVPGIPEKAEVVRGAVRTGNRALTGHIAVWADTRTAALVKAKVSGSLTSAHGTVAIGAVNWRTLASAGVSVHTRAWGTRAHPFGPRTYVVAGGRVVKVLVGAAGAARPGSGQTFLTAPAGTYGDALARLRVGDKVNLRTAEVGQLFFDTTHAPLRRPWGMVGAGGTLLLAGANRASCATRDEALRPRSVLAWTAGGDMIVIAIAGRGAGRTGGASVHQAAEYARRLGAVTAVNLDGGTSTTLLVRRTVGGPLLRLDQKPGTAQRPVVDALAFRT